MRLNYNHPHAWVMETFTGAAELGIDINISLPRELSDGDRAVLEQYGNAIADGIYRENLRLDLKVQAKRAEERREIAALFPKHAFIEEIPNGFCDLWCCSQSPWFIVTTTIGRIKIGWRKRVLQIDWSGSMCKARARDVFPDHKNTKFDHIIHCWDYDDARRDLAILLGVKK